MFSAGFCFSEALEAVSFILYQYNRSLVRSLEWSLACVQCMQVDMVVVSHQLCSVRHCTNVIMWIIVRYSSLIAVQYDFE